MKLQAGNKIVTKRQNNSCLWALYGAKIQLFEELTKGISEKVKIPLYAVSCGAWGLCTLPQYCICSYSVYLHLLAPLWWFLHL